MKMRAALLSLALLGTFAIAIPAAESLVAPPDSLPISSADKKIPIDDFTDVVIDWSRGQAILTEGAADVSPLVITLRGSVVSRISEVVGGTGMAMSEDGNSVWITVTTQDKVVRVDLDSLTVAQEIVLDPATCPRTVVETAGKVVIGDFCDGDRHDLLVHDLATTSTTRVALTMDGPQLATSPASPGIVAVGASNIQRILDVTTPVPTVVAENAVSGTQTDVAFSADGTTVAFSSDDPKARSATDLSLLHTYRPGRTFRSVAISPAGGHVAVGGEVDYEISIYVGADADDLTERNVPHGIEDYSLAWSDDGRWLFAVSMYTQTDDFYWHVMPGVGWPTCNGLDPTHVGSDGPDTILAGYGVVLAGDGDDSIEIRWGAGTVCGGPGNDVIRGWREADWLHGGRGDDRIIGGDGDDWLSGGPGTDTLAFRRTPSVSVNLITGIVNRGRYTDSIHSFENVEGTSRHDTIIGDAGANVLIGKGGRDVIDGRAGRDTIEGGDGHDVLLGGPGRDTITGGGGRDLIAGEGDGDSLTGGPGIDSISFRGSAKAVVVNLATGKAGGEGIDTISGVEWVFGTRFGDTIRGDASSNYLDGTAGRDTLFGRAGDDYLVGGPGTDSATGNAGIDSCVGAESVSSCEETIAFEFADLYNSAARSTRAAALFAGLIRAN